MIADELFFFFFSSRRRHTRFDCDWSSDVCSSDLETSDDGGPLGIPLDRLPEAAHQGGVRLPLDVLGWIEGGEAPYFSLSLIFDRKPPAWDAVSASANSSAVL